MELFSINTRTSPPHVSSKGNELSNQVTLMEAAEMELFVPTFTHGDRSLTVKDSILDSTSLAYNLENILNQSWVDTS